MIDTKKRSFAKSISWRITAGLATFVISLFVVSDFEIAGQIAILQLILNFFLYYYHERAWNNISWGKYNSK